MSEHPPWNRAQRRGGRRRSPQVRRVKTTYFRRPDGWWQWVKAHLLPDWAARRWPVRWEQVKIG